MNKEEIYDAQINPLMAQIIKICKKHKIAMLATFAIPTPKDDSLRCTSHLPDESGNLPADIARAVKIVRNTDAPMMITTEHADGSKTMTAILG